MRNLKGALAMLMTVPLGACIALHRNIEPVPPPGYHFSYLVQHGEDMHLIQAFDDGSNTYLQFKKTPIGSIDVRQSSDTKSLSYTVEPHYLKVRGIYDILLVSAAGVSSAVIHHASPPAPQAAATGFAAAERGDPSDPTRSEAMSAVIAPKNMRLPESSPVSVGTKGVEVRRVRAIAVGVPESLQTMHANLRVTMLKQEISTLEAKVQMLSAAIEGAHRLGSGASVFIRSVGGSSRVVLQFADNRFEIQVDEDLLAALGNAARAANRIYLHGHTDAYVASESGTELAIRRAVEVRKLLISLNVAPERIRLFYRGAGNFIANNSTPEGKALNRRVEIELRKW